MLSTRIRLAARNTLRRRARTLFTMGMVVLSVALLMLALTWIRGAFGSMLRTATAMGGHVRLVDPDFAAREELMPLYENLPDVEPLAEAVRQHPGVLSVEPRITAGVTLTVGEEIGDVFAMVVGASERYFRENLEAKEKVVDGTWFTGAPDELLVGHKVAKQLGAKVGDELVLLGTTQDGSMSSLKGRLVGIIRGGSGAFDQQVFAPLDKVQWLTDIPGGAVELLVFTEDFTTADTLAAGLRRLPALGEVTVQSWSEREPWKSTLSAVKGMESVVVFIFVFLTALGIWNTMMMSVLERTHEIGVLRAMGLSRLGAVGLFVGEALAVAIVGGVLGVALGAWPAWLLERDGIRIGEQAASGVALPISEVIRGDLNLEITLMSFGLGLLMAVLGSLPPAFRAASIQPVSAMRAGR
jgi:putative ABC transport system permease protein